MTAIAVALLVGLLTSTGGFLVYLDRLDRRHRSQVSELTTRIQHPSLVNPRALEREAPPIPDSGEFEREQAELERVGVAYPDGVPDSRRPEAE